MDDHGFHGNALVHVPCSLIKLAERILLDQTLEGETTALDKTDKLGDQLLRIHATHGDTAQHLAGQDALELHRDLGPRRRRGAGH